MTSINRIWLPWLQMYSWEHRHLFPPLLTPPAASTHTHARAHSHTFFFFYANGVERQRCTKDADLMVAMCSQILQSSDRLLWEVGRSSGLVSLCTASSLTQAWSCRGGGKGGDSGAGCFPGPPHSLILVELLLLPNLPECSTHPALNASFPRLFPRYCLQVLPKREKGITKLQAPPNRQLLDVVVFFLASPSSQRGGTKWLRWIRVNYAMPTIDNRRKVANRCILLPLFFSISKCKRGLGGKILFLRPHDRMWYHTEKYTTPIRHNHTWFFLEYVAWWSVCIPLEFLSYIYSALGHGRCFWCLLFIPFLCPSVTLPLPLKRHRNTTDTSASQKLFYEGTFILFHKRAYKYIYFWSCSLMEFLLCI